MPRPGSRPYDCVRRAWHSERHQPIRGTLIQEIFRVVNEIHGSATKKNKEYQEKLPVVVLRAEEIMYSKANSEAEYMDLATLLDRTNDAIDTIIRRDEHTETGEYLRPCIEAALSLGCSLTKASRSQRNSSRCFYLVKRSSTEEVFPNVSHTTKLQQCESENASKKKCVELEHQIQPPSNMFSVYPLYYANNNNNHPFDESLHGFKVSHKYSVSSNTCEPSIDNPEKYRSTNECDLSLRLGPMNIPASCCQVRTSQKDTKVELRRMNL